MRKFIDLLSLVLVSSMVSLSLTACGNDDVEEDNADVRYVTTYEVKVTPITLSYFKLTGDIINENGEITEIDLSHSVHYISPISTSTVPDHLQIRVNLEPLQGLDKYSGFVELGIETKKYTTIGEYLETVYSNRKVMCFIVDYPVEEIECGNFDSHFTLEAIKDKQGSLY